MIIINKKMILALLYDTKFCRKRNHTLKHNSMFCKKCKKYNIRNKSKKR